MSIHLRIAHHVHSNMSSQKVETAQMSTSSEQVNTLGFVPTMEYDSATKRNEAPSTPCVSLETLMPSERSQTQEGEWRVIPFM